MNTRLLFFPLCSLTLGLMGCPAPSDAPDAFVGQDGGPMIDMGPGRDTGPGRDMGPMPDMGLDAGTDAAVTDAYVPPDAFDPACSTTCDDGNACNGAETCDGTTGTCVPGVALVCDDSMACTTDSCDPVAGCVHVTPDTDTDGDDDCSDCAPTDPARHHGATEICNSLDDDCDLGIDESVAGAFYADCDGDGFAAMGAAVSTGCVAPPPADTGCGTTAEAWTPTMASITDWDCADDEPAAHSHVSTFHTTAIASAPDPSVDFDYDCDFAETPEFPSQGSCVMGTTCVLTMGWALAAIPDCGETGAFVTACGTGCAPTTSSRTQGCH